MQKIIVIGKNSRIYKYYISSILEKKITHVLSNRDDFDVCEGAEVILISASSKSIEDNYNVINRLKKSKPAKVILISSLSAEIAKCHLYKYPKVKRHQEEMVMENFYRFNIIRLGTVPLATNVSRVPDVRSDLSEIEHLLLIALNNNFNCILKHHKVVQYSNKAIDFYALLLVNSGFASIIFRPIDLVIRAITGYTYGYSLITYCRTRPK